MSRIGKNLADKIRYLMGEKCSNLRYIGADQAYLQYRPGTCGSQDWKNDKCHFEIEKIDDAIFDIAFHAEYKTNFLVELSKRIGKNEKIKGLKNDEYDDQKCLKRVNVVYDKVETSGDDDKNAQVIVDKMSAFYQNFGDEIIRLIEQSKNDKGKISFTTLLNNNHNIILHGAPGTGKTYLAKKIAKEMIFGDAEKTLTPEEQEQFNERCGFVQFHQSYDYTDFVEGLRPVNQAQGKIGFVLKDGVFKAFCKKALNFVVQDPSDSGKMDSSGEQSSIDSCIDEQINQGLEKLKEELRSKPNQTMKIPGISDNDITVTIDEKQIKVKTGSDNPCNINPGVIKYYIKTGNKDRGHYSYDPAVGKYILEHFISPEVRERMRISMSSESTTRIPPDAFVFIIDEINRGEMSKIFGELFFSIDPGYRGEKGKIKTQYQNLIDAKDPFADGFFIPKNVYIIGTMNDIDRSVESMDFAMRRRFAFKEIEAKDRIEMLDEIKDEKLKKLAIAKMNALNIAIEKTEGLSSAYHIGPAYFLKLNKYDGDFDKLWIFHIEGVVHEYLRGMDDAKGKQEKIETAYKEAKAE